MRLDTVSVVAGGWSFAEVDHSKLPGLVVAVNGAALHLRRRPEELVTMDRLWIEHSWSWLVQQHQREGAEWIMHARTSAIRIIDHKELAPQMGWIRTFKCNKTTMDLSNREGHLNGNNSGRCAINRAYQLHPRRVLLFGFDMCVSPQGRAYWYQHYAWAKGATGSGPRTYREWAPQFRVAAKQMAKAGIEVLNVSPSSRIDAFKKVSADSLGLT